MFVRLKLAGKGHLLIYLVTS